MAEDTCAWDGCDREVFSRGYCARDYQRARKQGIIAVERERTDQAGPCTVEDCPQPARTRGLCRAHYMRNYRHGDPGIQKKQRRGPTCSVDDCNRKHHSDGYCSTHYNRWKRNGDPLAPVQERQRNFGKTCAGPECDRPAVTKGLCNSHEYQERVRGELTPIREYKAKGVPCEIEGCDGTSKTDGLCQTHYMRRLRGEDNWDRLIERRRPHGEGHVNEDGYRVITVNGRPKLEHRHVVEQLLGRRLTRTETVHHLNGDRSDNRTNGPLHLVGKKYRSGNLEIWSTAQPAGQEIGHKLDWAVDMLRLYAPHLLAEEIQSAHGDLVPEVTA